MKLIEFKDRNGRTVMVNADKVLALYANDDIGPNGKDTLTFIETAPCGADGDVTGPTVKGQIQDVARQLTF